MRGERVLLPRHQNHNQLNNEGLPDEIHCHPDDGIFVRYGDCPQRGAARVRSPGCGEEAGGGRQDQLCGQVRQGCLGQRQGSPVREGGGRQEAGGGRQEQLYPEVREDGRRRRQDGSVREGGRRQEARWGGQEQLRAKVCQDHLSPGARGERAPWEGARLRDREGPWAPLLL